MERILGLDIGTKRIGVAISDPLCMFSQELGLVHRKTDKEAIDEICKLCQQYNVKTIVAGVPYNQDGSIGPQARDCMAFVKPLEQNYQIVYHDESLSSFEAEELLKKEGKKYTRNKGLVDIKSACLILGEYLKWRK